MGPRAVNFSEEDRVILRKVNVLLRQLHVEKDIENVSEIGAGVFVTLFEGLCGEQLQGIVRSAATREDEVHNCQVVIDSLAGDVLHTSLTHISGADVIDGNREAISNLLEIMSGLLEYMLNKIDDISTDIDDDGHNLTADDPDRLSRDELDEILEMELRRDRQLSQQQDTSAVKTSGPTAQWVEASSPSKGRENRSSAEAVPVGETTDDIINDSEEIEKRLIATRQMIQENEEINRRLAESSGKHASQPTERNGKETASDLPVKTASETQLDERRREQETRAEIIKRLENDPRYKYMLPPTSTQTQAEDQLTDETFRELQNMVEETAAMARAAVNCSSDQAVDMLRNLERRSPGPGVDAYRSALSGQRSGREHTRQVPRAQTSKRASPSARKASPVRTDRHHETELTPSQAKRKVSFLTDRSTSDSSPDISSRPFRRQDCSNYVEENSQNTSYQDRLKKRYEHIVSGFADDENSPDRQRTEARTRKYQQLSNRPKAVCTVGQTAKMVQQEKSAGKKKIGFLQKIYREDLDELMDEADYLLHQNRQTAKEKEKEYQKKMMTGVQTKQFMDKQAPSVLKKKARANPTRTVGSKVRKSSSATSGSIIRPHRNMPKTIKDDDDILPMLMDEFPHLHLSLHTWHELWRKGLTQIEQISRSHQEVKRKKSLAQNQLEEAEKRQEFMVNIVRKQLEHEHRLKEVKDRQASAISSRNKLHEKRIQSARSRNYYNEYQVRMRSKMLKRRTKEEMVFKKLFQDGLEIQKDRIRELRKYAKEHRDSEAKVQRNEIESMENYYRDQFQILAENIAKEKDELNVREKAQQQVLGSMKKDLRKKMEKEIKGLQEQLVRDDDDVYFRQLDADRVLHNLKMAKYQVCT